MNQSVGSSDAVMQPGLAASPLYNDDLAPTDPARRTWKWYHFAALWVGMVMNIASYMLAAGLTDQAHLTRAFANRYGVTPVRYQKQVTNR